MKRVILIILFTFYGSFTFSQKPPTDTEKLAITCKVWGFLKYYHPEVADGRFDWDKQLFEILPMVKAAETAEQLSQIFTDWIYRLGNIKKCKKCKINPSNDSFDKNFNLSWIDNNLLLTDSFSNLLREVEKNRHQGKKYYVSYYDRNLRIADFTNEFDYKDFEWQNENYRLLSLFRFWNMVEYFFPAKYQTDIPWDTVLPIMIPKFLNPKSETDFHLSMVELAGQLDDSHVRLNTQKTYLHFGHHYLPVIFKLIEGKAVITKYYNDSLARLNDLRIGDIITKANGKKIEEIFLEQEKYIMGSNLARKKFNASYYLLNGPKDSLELEILRKGVISTKSVARYLYKDFNYKRGNKTDKEYYIIDKSIGYINASRVSGDKVTEAMNFLKDTKTIIFDLRQYPEGTLYQFSKYVTSPRKSFYKALEPNLDYPGRYQWAEGSKVGTKKELLYKGNVILLVDEGCQSHCEFTVMALQTGNNVTTIGSQSSGADGNVVIFNMVGGFKTQMSGVGIFYPDGTEAQRKGVKIDIKVHKTLHGIAEGSDEILEKAIKFAKQSEY